MEGAPHRVSCTYCTHFLVHKRPMILVHSNHSYNEIIPQWMEWLSLRQTNAFIESGLLCAISLIINDCSISGYSDSKTLFETFKYFFKKIPQQAGIHSALISGFRSFIIFIVIIFFLHNWNLLGRIYLLTKVIGILGVFL